MIDAGMSIARLNFSWGTHEEHRHFVATVRNEAALRGKQVLMLQDLSGPRVQSGSAHTFTSEATVFTEKDKADVMALVALNIEYIALSFVSSAADIVMLRSFLSAHGSTAKIIAKIERTEALDNLEEIIQAADGIMIARGDLGEAIPFETLPFVKQDILTLCQLHSKPAIVATEMLSSMLEDPLPSRADISDIADAVVDGASATMLSNETAVGTNPAEAVAVMRKVVDEAYKHSTLQPKVWF